MSMSDDLDTLVVRIDVQLQGDQWTNVHTVPVPPDYRQQDIEPFIQHEMDKAVTALQVEAFGYARSARIIRQFNRRVVLIAALLRRAPHDVRNRPIIRRVREVIDMDQEELFARFGGDERLED
jgi:hypothetical protein